MFYLNLVTFLDASGMDVVDDYTQGILRDALRNLSKEELQRAVNIVFG